MLGKSIKSNHLKAKQAGCDDDDDGTIISNGEGYLASRGHSTSFIVNFQSAWEGRLYSLEAAAAAQHNKIPWKNIH